MRSLTVWLGFLLAVLLSLILWDAARDYWGSRSLASPGTGTKGRV